MKILQLISFNSTKIINYIKPVSSADPSFDSYREVSVIGSRKTVRFVARGYRTHGDHRHDRHANRSIISKLKRDRLSNIYVKIDF